MMYLKLSLEIVRLLLKIQTSTWEPKSFCGLDGQRLALRGPLEKLGHGHIRVLDKGEDFGLQILHTEKGATRKAARRPA